MVVCILSVCAHHMSQHTDSCTACISKVLMHMAMQICPTCQMQSLKSHIYCQRTACICWQNGHKRPLTLRASVGDPLPALPTFPPLSCITTSMILGKHVCASVPWPAFALLLVCPVLGLQTCCCLLPLLLKHKHLSTLTKTEKLPFSYSSVLDLCKAFVAFVTLT